MLQFPFGEYFTVTYTEFGNLLNLSVGQYFSLMVLTYSFKLHISTLLMFQAPCRCLNLELGSEVPLMCCSHQPGLGERTNWYSLKKPAVEEAKICVIGLLHTVWGHIWHLKLHLTTDKYLKLPDGNLRRLSSSCVFLTSWESTCTQLAIPVTLFCTEISSLCHCIWDFVVSPIMWLVEKVTFSYDKMNKCTKPGN